MYIYLDHRVEGDLVTDANPLFRLLSGLASLGLSVNSHYDCLESYSPDLPGRQIYPHRKANRLPRQLHITILNPMGTVL